LTRKKGISLKTPDIYNNKEKYKDKDSRYSLNNNTKDNLLIKEDSENKSETILKKWLAEIIKDKLQRKSFLSSHIHRPICLYRKTIEEDDNAVEEEITFVTGKQIVHVVYAYGGFIPSSFQTLDVFTIDAFTKWLIQARQKDLLLQYLEVLE
jgi:hypothetical protein